MMADCQSWIYSKDFQATRWNIVEIGVEEGPDQSIGIDVPPSDVLYAYKSGQIHRAAMNADPLHLCEIIRLGADMNLKDSNGLTALQLAMECLLCSAFISSNQLNRIRFIARTLIEQHVDIDYTPNTLTPLHSACLARDWELIELLLHHGARTTTPGLRHPADLLTSASDKERFRNLEKTPKTRPPQPCPCWSGKLLADCHAVDQPYPDTFYCICGSKRQYGKCCKKRGKLYFHRWNTAERYLKVKFQYDLGDALQLLGGRGSTQEIADAQMISMPRKFLPSETLSEEETRRFLERIRDGMQPKGLIEPAYGYAMQKLQFLPR